MLPAADAVPYAAAVGGGSGGNLQPVSVPQSAVTMEFSNDFPQPSDPQRASIILRNRQVWRKGVPSKALHYRHRYVVALARDSRGDLRK